MTTDIQMSQSIDVEFTVSKTPKQRTVEGRLWGTLKALAATEGNILFLSTLKKLGLATKDVKSFVEKQVCHKRVKQNVDAKVQRSAMQSKITDACAHAKRLRQVKNTQKNRVLKKYQSSTAKGRRVIKELISKYNQTKSAELEDARRKVENYKEKAELEKSLKAAPVNTSELLSNVNIFKVNHEVLPQEPLGPMICSNYSAYPK